MGVVVLSFAAGTFSVLSPCVLPLLPIVIASALQSHCQGPLALAAGLVLSSAVTGLAFASLGFTLGVGRDVARAVAALLMAVAGLALLLPRLQAAFAAGAAPLARGADVLARRQPPGLGGDDAPAARAPCHRDVNSCACRASDQASQTTGLAGPTNGQLERPTRKAGCPIRSASPPTACSASCNGRRPRGSPACPVGVPGLPQDGGVVLDHVAGADRHGDAERGAPLVAAPSAPSASRPLLAPRRPQVVRVVREDAPQRRRVATAHAWSAPRPDLAEQRAYVGSSAGSPGERRDQAALVSRARAEPGGAVDIARACSVTAISSVTPTSSTPSRITAATWESIQ